MKAGRLKNFINEWKKITTDQFILNCLEGYKIPFKDLPFQSKPPLERKFSAQDWGKIKIEIKKLLNKRAIEECIDEPDQFISPFFLVPKSDGSNRFIFNLKKLNEFVETVHFKMEDIRSARNLISEGVYMCSVDVKDAYYLISIHKAHRKCLRLKFLGKTYQFTCLPFGLSTSPYVFTKIMKPVIKKLRDLGILLVIYIDDILILGKTYIACVENTQKVIRLLETLGFVINYKKSTLIPTRTCQYLGFILNSRDLSLELTEKKKEKIGNLLGQFKVNQWYKVRDIAQLLGVLTAASPAVAYSQLYTKRLEREKFLALTFNGNDFEGKMYFKEILIEDLEWWKNNILIGVNPFRTYNYVLEIFSDSSLTGWGAHSEGKSTYGFWNAEERKWHINYLELLAAFFALKSFASKLVKSEILLRIDNTTALAYVNKMGGVKFDHLSQLARKIWQWCEMRKLWITAAYIPSKENYEADIASRQINIDTEWEIAEDEFRKINNKFGPFSVDLFASRLNAKCSRYYSRFPDPLATSIDAFTVAWDKEKFYAFPPFAIILRCLQKIKQDRAEGILVVPQWPTQPWYPLFMSLLKERPLILKPSKNLLLSPCRTKSHPLASSMALVVGNLSGQLS